MTEIADEFRRSILRKEFYMDVLNGSVNYSV